MILLLLLIFGVRSGWSFVPQATAFVAAPTPSFHMYNHNNAIRAPRSLLCAFEPEDNESTKDSPIDNVSGIPLLSSLAASVGTTLLAAVASALRNDDDDIPMRNRNDGTTVTSSTNKSFGTINRRRSIQNMANTALSITAGNLLGGITAAGTATAAATASGGAAAAMAIYERTLSLGGSAVASEELLAWIASQKALAATPEIVAWMAAQKRLQLLRGVGATLTGVVTRAGMGAAFGAASEGPTAALEAEVEALATTSSTIVEEASLTRAVAATAVVSKALSVNDDENDLIPVKKLKDDEILAKQGASQQAEEEDKREELN